MPPLESLHDAIRAAAAAVLGAGVESVKLEQPPRAELGDYSTNAPLLLAPRLGIGPHEVAGRLAGELEARLGGMLERAEVAGPGFLNLYLRDQWFVDALSYVLTEGERFGAATLDSAGADQRRVRLRQPDRAAAHRAIARQAAYGDALARILELRGYERHTRVLHQRLRQPGRQARRVRSRGRARRAGARGGYQGEYVGRLVAGERARELNLETLAAGRPARPVSR